ncbi:16632_t:CDS:1, partial [Gigaspora rosea]
DGLIQLNEFDRLIELLYYYDEVYHIFQQLDKNKDESISFEEFKKGHELVGI